MKISALIRVCAWAFIALLSLAVLGQSFSRSFPLFSDSSGREIKAAAQSQLARVSRNEDVSSVSVSWVAGAVRVYFTDGDQIEYAETSDRSLSDDQKLYSKVSGDTLSIEFTRKNRKIGDLSKTLELFIPRSIDLDRLKIEGVSNAVTVDGADTQIPKVSIQGISGEIALTAMRAGEITVSTVSGGVALSGICDAFRIETVSGEARIDLLQMPESIRGTSVSGGLTITLPENDGFTAKLTSFSGAIRSDFGEGGDRKSIVYKDGDASIRLESVSGSIAIRRGSAAPETPRATATPEIRIEPEDSINSVSSGSRTF